MESELILYIIDSFFEIKDFFYKNSDKDERINFLKAKVNYFYKKFYESGVFINDEKAQEHLEKRFSVFIKYKDTSFIFPHTFVKYIALEEEHKTVYLKDIESFFMFVKKNKNLSLHSFLSTYFYYLQQIHFKLSNLEIEVLKLLTNNNFMYYFQSKDSDEENFRTYPPTYIEIVETLKNKGIPCSSRSIQKIKTDLYQYQVCYDRRIFANYAKIGFVYILIENAEENSNNLNEYTLWLVQNGNKQDKILCIPFGDTDRLLQNKNYEILHSFYFNVNLDQYDRKNHWNNFTLPYEYLFSEENEYMKNSTNHWNIQPLQKLQIDIDNVDIEILDNLIKSNTSNIPALDRLTHKITKNHIDKRLQKLAKNGLFRFHSQVNFLGIEFSIRFKIYIERTHTVHRLNIINFFCNFPEIMLFTNEKIIMGYARVPKHIVGQLLENIYLFNLLYSQDKKNIFIYSENYYSIKNTIYVLDKVELKNGIASIIEK